MVEKAAGIQLAGYLDTNEMKEPLQSAYKRHHSTETALVKVFEDILCRVDSNKVVAMTLLDLSAAFDTVDNNVMLRRFKDSFGVCQTALEWLQLYFNDRHFRVNINNDYSSTKELDCSVPQGSYLGPQLYSAIRSRWVVSSECWDFCITCMLTIRHCVAKYHSDN